MPMIKAMICKLPIIERALFFLPKNMAMGHHRTAKQGMKAQFTRGEKMRLIPARKRIMWALPAMDRAFLLSPKNIARGHHNTAKAGMNDHKIRGVVNRLIRIRGMEIESDPMTATRDFLFIWLPFINVVFSLNVQ